MDASRLVHNEAESCFRMAATHAGLVEHCLRLGGCRLLLRFAGEKLARALMPPLAHLLIPSKTRPEFTLHLWEDPTFETPWWFARAAQRGEYAIAHHEGHTVIDRPAYGELALIERGSGQGFLCLRKPETIYRWTPVSPLRGAINALFQERGAHLVHAAAVGTDGAAALLVGRGGSGKSSSALECLHRGDFQYLADDLCLVDAEAPAPRVHSVYNSLRLAPHDARRFAALSFRPGIQGFVSDKLVGYLHPKMSERLVASLPLRALLLPRIVRGPARLAPASAAAAFQALLPWTLATVPSDWRTTTAALGRLTRRLPAHWLEIGPDREQIPSVIAEFLRRPQRAAA